jgi:hypothetical protein
MNSIPFGYEWIFKTKDTDDHMRSSLPTWGKVFNKNNLHSMENMFEYKASNWIKLLN